MKLSSKKKLLIENFLVYGVGSMINKIIPLVMLPIVTRLMPSTYYFGLNDMVNLTFTFGSAIVVMGLYDAMFRLFFEKEDIKYKKEICSTAISIVLLNALVALVIFWFFNKFIATVIFGSDTMGGLAKLTGVIIFVSAINNILAAPIRMENRRKVFLILNFTTSVIGYCISIPLLINKQFLIALPVAQLVSVLLLSAIYYSLSHKWFTIKDFNKIHVRELLSIGIPLMPTFLAYWVFNSLDRIMIRNMMDLQAVGIYAIGAKVATVSQLIYQAFAQGWQYFSFSTMKDKNNTQTISRIFEVLLLISLIAFIVVSPFINIVFNILFEGDYRKGSLVFPYLFLSPLLLMLFQSIANQFLVVKKSYFISLSLIFGLLVNAGLNIFLIPLLGTMGAGLATFFGYFTNVIATCILLTKKDLLQISGRAKILLILTPAFVLVVNTNYKVIVGAVFLIFIGYIYRNYIFKLLNRGKLR